MFSNLIYIKTNFFIILFLTIMIGQTQASSKDKEEAEKLVTFVGTSIIEIVDSESNVKKKQMDLLKLISNYADIKTISRAALGARWRKLDYNTKEKFIFSFQNYLINKYGEQFNEFKGSKMIMERTIDAGKKGILVNSRFIMPGSTPIAVGWQLWNGSGQLRIIDIIIEGISMLSMEREEMKNRLQKNGGDIRELIHNLQSL